jgi:hypothetical protein
MRPLPGVRIIGWPFLSAPWQQRKTRDLEQSHGLACCQGVELMGSEDVEACDINTPGDVNALYKFATKVIRPKKAVIKKKVSHGTSNKSDLETWYQLCLYMK